MRTHRETQLRKEPEASPEGEGQSETVLLLHGRSDVEGAKAKDQEEAISRY